MINLLVVFFMIIGCSHNTPTKKSLSLILGCSIHNQDGKIIKSFPGTNCVYFPDGSLVSYNPVEKLLQKFDKNLSVIWTLPLHVHHGIHLTHENKLLINSSVVKENIRYDEIFLIDLHGRIQKKYSFYEHFDEIKKNFVSGKHSFEPYKTSWDQNLNFTHEYSHLAASYEIAQDMPGFAQKGSILLTFNTYGRGVYVLSKDFNKITHYEKLTVGIFHDAQSVNSHEIVYFVNTGRDKRSRVEFYDVNKNKVSKTIDRDFFAFFAGSVQIVNDDLVLVTDGKSKHGKVPDLQIEKNLSLQNMVELSKETFNRIIYLSGKGEVIKELHLDFKIGSAKLQDVQSFLKHNLGL